MSGGTRGSGSRSIEILFRSGTSCGLSDTQLLERFLDRDERDGTAEAAFEALVSRHGPMVLDVCRNTLGNRSRDVEDAFQATFLILATKAASIRRGTSIASWLYGVALRSSARLKLDVTRRQIKERRAAESRCEEFREADSPPDLSFLHEEVGRLPSKYRDPIILCYFEGMSQEMAASQLRCPASTVGVRLMRAKARLKSRLERRGDVLAPSIILPPVPSSLLGSTVQSAIQFTEAGPVALAVAQLTKEVAKAMFMMKLKQAAAALLVVGTLATGTGFLTHLALAEDPQPKPASGEIEAKSTPAKPKSDLEELQGTWLALYDSPVFAEGVVKSIVKRREKWIIDGNSISTFFDEALTGNSSASATVIPFKITPGQPPKKLEDTLRSKKSNDSPLISVDTFPDLKIMAAFAGEPTTGNSGTPGLIPTQRSLNPPASIDLKLPGLTNPMLGIYELNGDWLRICYMPDSRPDKFVGDPHKFKILVYLKRVPPPAKDVVQRSDLEELQGTWATKVELNYAINNIPQPTEQVPEKWVVNGDTIRTFIRPTEKEADTLPEVTYLIKLDPSKTPKAIDLTMPALGTLSGIYELDGDSLRICFGYLKRPTAFVHDPKDSSELVTLKRLRRTPEEIAPRFALTPGCYWVAYPSKPGSSQGNRSFALTTEYDSNLLRMSLACPASDLNEGEKYRPVAFDAEGKRYYPKPAGGAGTGGEAGKMTVALHCYRLDKNTLGGKKITHVGVELVTPEALEKERERGFKPEAAKPKP